MANFFRDIDKPGQDKLEQQSLKDCRSCTETTCSTQGSGGCSSMSYRPEDEEFDGTVDANSITKLDTVFGR